MGKFDYGYLNHLDFHFQRYIRFLSLARISIVQEGLEYIPIMNVIAYRTVYVGFQTEFNAFWKRVKCFNGEVHLGIPLGALSLQWHLVCTPYKHFVCVVCVTPYNIDPTISTSGLISLISLVHS